MRPMRFDATRHVHDVIAGLVSLVFPPHCTLCRTPGDDALCPACHAALPPPRLGPAPDGVAWIRAACRYDGAAKACVRRLKYDARVELAAPMAARMLAASAATPVFHAEAFVPVPLHAVRARERTFNQAAVLAAALSTQTGRPVLHALVRRRLTVPQSSLAVRARRRNVTGAFRVARPSLVRGRRLLLIDDVVTTGATARACARALRAAGAAEVGVLAFAHG